MSALHAVGVVLAVGPASDALLASAGALAAVTVAATAATALYGRSLAGRADDSEARARLDRARLGGAVLAYLVALAAMAAVGWFGALNDVVDALPVGRTGLTATLVTVGSLLVPVVAALGAVAGTVPAARTLDDSSSAGSPVRGLARALLAVTAAATALVLAVTAANPNTATGLGWIATSAALAVLLAAGAPRVARLFASVREPTAAERERLERCCEAVGLTVVAVRVVEKSADDAVATSVRGLPGRRHLFVGDRLLEQLDDDHLRACLALQAGRSRRLHPELRALTVVAPLVVAGAFVDERLVLPGVPPAVGAAVVLAVGLVGLWLGQRLIYRADAEAVDRTNREAVLETLQTTAALGASPTLGRVAALRRMEPPLARRVDRLRRSDGGAASAADD